VTADYTVRTFSKSCFVC